MAIHKAGSGARLRHDIRAKTARALLLSTELDSARVERGFTTRQLAELMTMSPAMINRIMNGRKIPDALELGGLCALLDIPPRRREHLYGLRRESEDMNWVIHATSSTRDPDDVVRSLWSLADGITTYATSVTGPRAPGGSGGSTAPASPGHHGDAVWTRYVSADAIERAPYELGTPELRLARLARFDGVRIVPTPRRHFSSTRCGSCTSGLSRPWRSSTSTSPPSSSKRTAPRATSIRSVGSRTRPCPREIPGRCSPGCGASSTESGTGGRWPPTPQPGIPEIPGG